MKIKTKESIALFGTSADPPTMGHKKILEELSKIYSLTITFASNNPQKNHKEDISIRSLLLKTLINDLNNPKVIFNQKLSSQWAFESIKKCKNVYEINTLDFVIGSDLVNNIFSWKNFDKILNEVNFLIILREGYPVESCTLRMLKTYGVNFRISTLNIPRSSSTMIRSNTNDSNLPESLLDIIKKNNLYEFAKSVE